MSPPAAIIFCSLLWWFCMNLVKLSLDCLIYNSVALTLAIEVSSLCLSFAAIYFIYSLLSMGKWSPLASSRTFVPCSCLKSTWAVFWLFAKSSAYSLDCSLSLLMACGSKLTWKFARNYSYSFAAECNARNCASLTWSIPWSSYVLTFCSWNFLNFTARLSLYDSSDSAL